MIAKSTFARICLVWGALFVFTGLAFASQRGIVEQTALPHGGLGTYHALLIGINQYREWPALQTAVHDAVELRNVLVELYGFDEANVLLRTDDQATRLLIISDLRRMASQLGDQDNLLVYFAGHGQLDDLTGDGYWIPVDGRLKDPGTWVSQATIKGILGSEKARAKNVVVIADSCYSGSLLRGGPSLLRIEGGAYQEKLAEAAAKRSRQVITSGGMEPVADGGRDGHSLFAYYLIKALRENDREIVDLENLFHTRVWGPVTQIGGQRPNVGRLKTPMDEDGQFILVNSGLRKRKSALAAEKAREREKAEAQARGETEKRERLEAERRLLEAERRQLEEERRLLKERKTLEAERLALEKEKQRMALEAEQKRLEEERARMKTTPAKAEPKPPEKEPTAVKATPAKAEPAPRVTSISPAAAPAPSTPLPGRITVAVLPWSFEYFYQGYDTKVRPHFSFGIIEKVISEKREFQLTDSAYSTEAPVVEGVQPLSLSPEEDDHLWVKKGLFSQKELDTGAAVAIGRRLGVDLTLLLHTSPGGRIEFTLVETSTGRVFEDSQRIDWRSYFNDLDRLTRDQFQQYLEEVKGR